MPTAIEHRTPDDVLPSMGEAEVETPLTLLTVWRGCEDRLLDRWLVLQDRPPQG